MISTKLVVFRAEALVRRADRARRRRLEREVAAFATPAERSELRAILGRHAVEQSQEVWSILNRQALAERRAPDHYGGRDR
jgi:hypothetical protein